MDKLDNLLKQYQVRHNLGQSLTSARIVEVANKVSAGRYNAISFRDGRLKIEASAGPPLYFLRQKNNVLIQEINEALGQETVQKIIYRGV